MMKAYKVRSVAPNINTMILVAFQPQLINDTATLWCPIIVHEGGPVNYLVMLACRSTCHIN